MEHIAKQLTEAEKVLQRLIEERRREPKNDLISTLVHRKGVTACLPDHELVVLCNFLCCPDMRLRKPSERLAEVSSRKT